MTQEIRTITLRNVNCYLVRTDTGYVLIDTGYSGSRRALETELESAGCRPGNLQLILITHGDFDHTGNGAYLHGKYGTRIAMHHGDSGMVERGDMFWNRTSGNALIRAIIGLVFRPGKSDRFTPDLYVEDGFGLSGYGFDARVVSIPGHSAGSIGILTSDGDLFGGDLLSNTNRPALNSLMDDPATGKASVDRLKSLGVGTVYPGHGKPFPMAMLAQ